MAYMGIQNWVPFSPDVKGYHPLHLDELVKSALAQVRGENDWSRSSWVTCRCSAIDTRGGGIDVSTNGGQERL